MRRLALDRDRPRRAVIMRRGLAGALQPVGEEADGVVVLGMHHDQRAGLARHAHHVEHFHVGERQALIGHEHLERGVAVVDQRRQFLAEHAVGGVGDDEMERDVDVALAVGLGVIVLHHLAQALALLLHGERQHHGVAAERGRARAEAKSSAMTMPGPDGWAIWTWLSMPPGSTSMPLASTISVASPRFVAERGDPAAADADIAGERVGCGRDRAAADDGVEGHGLF